MKRISGFLVLIFTLSFFSCFFISSTVYASSNPPADKEQQDEIKNTLSGRESKGPVLGDDPKNVVLGMSKEVLDIIRIFVVTGLIIAFFKAFSEFKHVGDNPQLKAKLKVEIGGILIGVLGVINFWNIYDFLSKINIKLGG